MTQTITAGACLYRMLFHRKSQAKPFTDIYRELKKKHDSNGNNNNRNVNEKEI